ncbi:uncharacterized protein [Parasteatoda tepidariorum]|uniref:uncharacterized protein n=1 Tax=Parasteatoda tepidariorum TaxID=114398 RepID=UPI00077FC918|nr:uncharacterized protein LOC107449777 [Parasteatoda tepidariorum]XP_015920909.1 uncharacterized protein LOC107449777 [Parasteatoda tepidariorum]XP_015920911.1 uncharacterized protein LOC107449777 [Parasteatoda tepidariorum]XP_015920912.1 uncharacterized protein LOC107449777 [Parasteatoda tepidariorum]
MLLPVFVFMVIWRFGTCQRYADRTPIPVPINDAYDEYYSEAYDFDDKKDIYRWNVDEIPHPQDNFRFCNRMKTSYICDPDMILDKEQADKLDANIRQLFKETPCICDRCDGEEGGIVIGIALLKYVFQPYNEHPSQIIRSFTERLRSKWQLGKCDNDILIIVATADRLAYTDVGKATSAYVSLKEAYRIFLENKAQFSAGHFYEGLNDMLTDYYEMTRSMKRPPAKDKLNLGTIIGSIVGAVVVLAIIFLILVLLYRRYKRAHGKAIDEVDDSKHEVSSWKKQDIRVMFDSLKMSGSPAPYQPCSTDDTTIPSSTFGIDEEIIDTTPASTEKTQLTEVNTSSSSEVLENDLNKAVKTHLETFDTYKHKYNKHETDL